MTESKEEIILTTPPMVLPFRAHLIEGDKEKANQYPNEVTLGDGRTVNLNFQYRITGEWDANSEESKLFVARLEELYNSSKKPDTDHLKFPIKKGTVRTEDGKYVPSDDKLRLEFHKATYKGKIPVIENGERVGLTKEMLPRKTEFTVEFVVKNTAFTTKEGVKKSGLLLEPRAINVLKRPELKSIPSRILNKK